MTIIRSVHNPLISPRDVKPSRPDFRVLGVFNAGVAVYGAETLLLVRVAEAPVPGKANEVLIPKLNERGEIDIEHLSVSDPRYNFSDTRFVSADGEVVLLTSMSHLRLARSSDGIHFTVEEKPALFPENELEAWGIEDPRITQIDDKYYITYSAAFPGDWIPHWPCWWQSAPCSFLADRQAMCWQLPCRASAQLAAPTTMRWD
jgi:predicted GH43/DUF377 family glycosyl hydrolase